jgi:type II secretory pathway component PulM
VELGGPQIETYRDTLKQIESRLQQNTVPASALRAVAPNTSCTPTRRYSTISTSAWPLLIRQRAIQPASEAGDVAHNLAGIGWQFLRFLHAPVIQAEEITAAPISQPSICSARQSSPG